MPPIVCSSHTISGIMPNSPVASRHGFADRVRACAEAGFDGMCLHFRDYAEQAARGASDIDLRAVLDHHGMRENSVEFLRDWFEPGGEDKIDLALRAARAFDARFINVGGDFDGRLPVAAMGPAFARLCRRAADIEVGIAVEIVAWGNVQDPASASELLAHGGPNAGIVLDAWHIFRGGIALERLAGLGADRIFCVQLSDAGPAIEGPLSRDTMHRRFCGEGVLPLGRFLDTLAQMGVSAPVACEVIAPEVAAMTLDEAARRALATTRQVVAGSEMMVRS